MASEWKRGVMRSSLPQGLKKADEAGSSLKRLSSSMENGLDSPFYAPNLEVMEQKGML